MTRLIKEVKNRVRIISRIYYVLVDLKIFIQYKIIKNKNYKKLIRYKETSHLNSSTKPIKVVFLVTHAAIWKSDAIFQKMLCNKKFEPIILVIPFLNRNFKEHNSELMEQTFKFFDEKNYPVLISFKGNDDWLDLKEDLNADAIFFSNPHKITLDKYYEEAFSNYVSYYVPYYYQITKMGGYRPQYNQLFHNAMWKIFSPHKVALDIHKTISVNSGCNVIDTGYPFSEPFFNENYPNKHDVWKWTGNNKLRIIWAPHHTIDTPQLPFSSFLKYSQFFQDLAFQNKKTIQWSFKPHPLLKEKLYHFEGWGKEKTDKYWEFWRNSGYTQLDEEEYIDLFKTSDAIIHDSGSFLVEYMLTNKPALFLVADEDYKNYFNEMGLMALFAHNHAKDIEDINNFIKNLLSKKDPMKELRAVFLKKNINNYYEKKLPSDKIIENILNDFLP
tara:strand:+ start:162 stop:1490 length:1329 start_codon:yes stop_codon:yes gene_type:complete